MSEKLTKSQKKAVSKIQKLAEIHILKLDKRNVGISIKGNPDVSLESLATPIADLLEQMLDCTDALQSKTLTFEQFQKWQQARQNKKLD